MKKILLTILALFLSAIFLLPRVSWAETRIDAELKFFDLAGNQTGSFFVFDQEFTGGMNLGTIDLGGDGVDEILVSSGPGSRPEVKIYRQDGSLIESFLAYNENFTGGVNIASGDLDGDGRGEIITAAGFGGGPHVRIFDSYGRPKINAGFFADEPDNRWGVEVAVGDINGDERDEIIVGLRQDDEFKIKIYNTQARLIKEFVAFDNVKDLGFSLISVDLGSDGVDEIVVGAGFNRWPEVKIFRADGSLIKSFLAYPEGFQGGVELAGFDLDADGLNEIITGAGFGGGPHVRIFDNQGRPKINAGFFAFDKNLKTGLGIGVVRNKQNKQIIALPRQNIIQGDKILNKLIDIDISEQKLRYYQTGLLIDEQPVSSGRLSMPTPMGEFKILGKDLEKYSRPYDLYMPHWMQFTWSGAGIHGLPFWKYSWGVVYEGVNHLGQRVSHGCVRLPLDAAEKLYQWANIGDAVVVHK